MEQISLKKEPEQTDTLPISNLHTLTQYEYLSK